MGNGERPNILWYCTDKQRYDTIPALGNPHIHTPNLDTLCEHGVAFTNAYTQSPICTPSRATFLTGRYKLVIYEGEPIGELFDLESDPGEFTNFWDDPASSNLRSELTLNHFKVCMATSDAGIRHGKETWSGEEHAPKSTSIYD